MDDYLTTEELAEVTRSPKGTVGYWRHIGYGPKGIKVGKRVLYRRADVEAWLEQLRTGAA